MNKKIDLGSLYRRLFDAYSAAYADKKKQIIQEEVNALWKRLKNNDNIEDETESKIKELQVKLTKKKGTLLSFFSKNPSSSKALALVKPQDSKEDTKLSNSEEIKNVMTEPSRCQSLQIVAKPTPSQHVSKNKIIVLESELNSLVLARDAGIATDDATKKITTLQKDIQAEKTSLKRKIDAAKCQKKSRDTKKQKFLELCENNPDVATALKLRNTYGRPRVEENQSGLLEVIKSIALFDGAADDRRRTEVIRCCKTLDDLQAELFKQGYTISRSGLYLRLLPKRVNTEEGKKHVVTVPVKLCKPDSTIHSKHKYGKFCTATIRNLESVASILGPDQVFFFLSMDDKARVPLGITAANAQAPMLMHLDYRVQLPDHDFVVAEKHKLIPSVYAGILIKKDGEGSPEAVTYSGPTYVAIRSGKHSSSNAETHAIDIHKLSELPTFENLLRTREGFVKPVFIFTCDGGPDENPRYERVIISAIKHFKDFDLDAIFIATNAPGRSAFNRVERRMAPLSRELTGVISNHDDFGLHLDSSNRTIDLELEKRNFESAGNVLADIWSKLVIDEFPVVAEYFEI
nr:uncharacterized protein LOC111510519 [Leptinotarsa decemlineata]